jgi:hypothetical protein
MTAELRTLLDLIGRDPDERLSVCFKASGGPFSVELTKVADAEVTGRVHAGGDCWFSVQPLADRVVSGRGTARDVIGLRALYADLDMKPGGMRTAEDALAVIQTLAEMLNAEPVAVVASGHGYQPYWRIERGPGTDWSDDSDDPRRTEAAALLRRFGRLVARLADVRGAAVDSVYDLPRVLRVPGTVNRKDEAVPARTRLDVVNGAPLSLEHVREALDAYTIAEWPEDRDILGEVVAPTGEWRYAETTCSYVARMVGLGWRRARRAAPVARCAGDPACCRASPRVH